MDVIPIASDSMGVRSMVTYVETKDANILIDPSAALGPKRYGLPPTKIEVDTLLKIKQDIAKRAEASDVLIISHYHYDHYDPHEQFYEGKKVFAKDIRNHINKSQTARGKEFKEIVQETCNLIYCDDSTHKIGETEIRFSPPFFHGPSQVKLGYVLMTTIDDGTQRLLHASDVQGPVTAEAKEYIISQHPDLLIMDGPPTIFLGWKFSMNDLKEAQENLVEILRTIKCKLILDHHLLRDIKYKENFPEVYKIPSFSVKTFAEYLGENNNTLEAHRKELWGK
jgi:predicted metallo-beta-lactamase superfamily hydrolase